MKLYTGSSNFIPKNTAAKLLHSSPGKVHAIILTIDTVAHGDGTLTLYDNTTASGAVLLVIHAHPYSPTVIQFDKLMPLRFETGLTALTSAYADAFVVTEC